MSRTHPIDRSDPKDRSAKQPCRAVCRSGARCRGWPLFGQDRCTVHSTAAERLRAAQDRTAVAEARVLQLKSTVRWDADAPDVLADVARRLTEPAPVFEAAARHFEEQPAP
ncbi:hypothetical protein ACQ86D_26455 [Streptomyces galilaeus]